MESVGVVYIPSSAQSDVDTPAASQHPTKRRKLSLLDDYSTHSTANKWRTHSLRRIYSTKLLEALRRCHTPPRSRREVRDTADRVLASAARGSTRWSRAILSNSMNRRTRTMRRRRSSGRLMRSKSKKATGDSRLKRKLPAVEKRLRLLRRLVPGCRKVRSFRSMLEEAGDYISALEMQVKAMAALAHLLSPAGTSPASPHPSR